MSSQPILRQALIPRLTNYIPHTPTVKQQAFLWLMCLDAFYGGAVGGGKSDSILMASLQFVDIPKYNALIIRDKYTNLTKPEGLITRSFEWLKNLPGCYWNPNTHTWHFKTSDPANDATVGFGYLDGPQDHFNYDSAAYQFIGIDEATAIRRNQALYLFSRLRKLKNPVDIKKEEDRERYRNIPLRFRCASNPPRREQVARGTWVKERYVDSRTRKQGVIFIPANMGDNPYLDIDAYNQSLSELDPITRAQLKDGDWEINAKSGIFKREDFQLVERPFGDIERTVRFWDFAATEPSNENKEPAYTSGVKMSKTTQGMYIIEHVDRFRKNPGPTETRIRQLAEIDGRKVVIRAEQEGGSSGKIAMDHYRKNVVPGWDFKGERALASKFERATPLANEAEAHNVYVVIGEWNEAFFDEAEVFPDGMFKDQIDAASGAFNELSAGIEFKIREV